jgi:hypothetical protein
MFARVCLASNPAPWIQISPAKPSPLKAPDTSLLSYRSTKSSRPESQLYQDRLARVPYFFDAYTPRFRRELELASRCFPFTTHFVIERVVAGLGAFSRSSDDSFAPCRTTPSRLWVPPPASLASWVPLGLIIPLALLAQKRVGEILAIVRCFGSLKWLGSSPFSVNVGGVHSNTRS